MQRMNWIDQAINFVSPGAGLKRMQQRQAQKFFRDSVRKYEGAAKGRRTQNWQAPSTSAPAEIQRALVDLRNRSRDLVRNNPYAFRAVKKIVNNVVGMGIVPTPTGVTRMQEQKIKKLWKKWADKTVCDFDGHSTLYGIQQLVMRAVVESGECLVRKRIVQSDSNPIALELQVLEADFIDTTKHGPLPDGGQIFYGIEFNKLGKVVAYWLWEQHPGGDIFNNFNLKSNRYSADEIIHVFEKFRPGQFRGVPGGVASMIRMKDLDEYQDAQLVRQKIAACFTVFVTDNGPQIGSPSSEDDFLEKVEPGIIEHLPAGKTVTMAQPPAAEGYGEYTKSVLREIAAGYDMDYVTLTGDLTAVNFSSGRMGWIEFNKSIQAWQWHMLIPMCCEKLHTWFIQMATIYGYTKSNPDLGVDWTTPRREMIDPVKETAAIIDAVQNGLLTWDDAILEAGYLPEDQVDKMKKAKDRFEKAGLPNFGDAVAMSGKQPTKTQDMATKPDNAEN